MENKLYDSELKVMSVLWEGGDLPAQQIAKQLTERIGWSKTTTYTMIKKCIDKGIVERIEPGFMCHALITREQARETETNELIDKLYGGSPDLLVASLLDAKRLSAAEIAKLRQLVDQLK